MSTGRAKPITALATIAAIVGSWFVFYLLNARDYLPGDKHDRAVKSAIEAEAPKKTASQQKDGVGQAPEKPPVEVQVPALLSLKDALLTAFELGCVTDSRVFLQRLRELINSTSEMPVRDRDLVWRKLALSLNKNQGALKLVELLAPIHQEMVELDKSVRMADGYQLTAILMRDCLPKPMSPEWETLSNRVSTLTDNVYKLQWTAALKRVELFRDGVAGVTALSSIENKALRALVEPQVLANASFGNPQAAANYFLTGNCVSEATPGLAHAIFADWLLKAPEQASETIKMAAPSRNRDMAIWVMIKKISDDSEAAEQWRNEIGSKDILAMTDEWLRRINKR